MKTIWKENIPIKDVIQVMLPKEAEVLTVQVDRTGKPAIWFVCDPKAEKEKRQFKFYGTGRLHNNIVGTYVGTIQIINGAGVFHLFEIE